MTSSEIRIDDAPQPRHGDCAHRASRTLVERAEQERGTDGRAAPTSSPPGAAPAGAKESRRANRHRCSRLSTEEQVACVRAAARGELAALGLLYDLFLPGLMKSAEALLDEPADAADIVQEVFLRLCDHADQYDPSRGSVWLWLATITRHACFDRNRAGRVRLRARRSLRAGSEALTDDVPDVLALLTLQRRLSSLKPTFRRTLYLMFWEDVSYGAIAARERVSVNTVKARGARAMDALKRHHWSD